MKPKNSSLHFALLVAALWPSGSYGQSAVPFQVVQSLPAASYSSGFKILFETGDKTYVPLNFGIVSPYKLLSSADQLNAYTASGSHLFNTLLPAPVGVSVASQLVALGDFFGNGSVGFAYIDVYNNAPGITVFLFDPSLVFVSMTNYPVGTYPGGVVAADFNGDGKPDLAVSFNGGVGILLNQGNGTFSSSVTYSSGTIVSGLTAADINHDGKIDLIGTTNASGENAAQGLVLLGKGDGTFVQSSFASGTAFNLVTGDFNGDGNLDIAATTPTGFAVFLGQGNGSFTAGSSLATGSNPQYLAAGDFNGDGKLDLAVANTATDGVAIALGDGHGNFQIASQYAVSDETTSLIVTDYNGDGKLDILAGFGDARAIGPNLDNKSIDVLLGRGDGTFQGEPTYGTPVSSASVMLTADFNGDGKTDVLLGGNAIYLLNGLGSGIFQQPVSLSLASSQVVGGATADFNGDGKPDVAFIDVSGTIDVALNLNGALQASSSISAGAGSAGPMVAADFNTDGKIDLAVGSSSFGSTNPELTLFQGSGTGTFTESVSYPLPAAATDIETSDLNNDGKPDLVVSAGGFFAEGSGTGQVLVFLNNGRGGFAQPVSYSFSVNPQIVTIADVNGDNHPDLLVSTSDNGGNWFIGVALGNGDGTFQTTQLVPTAFGIGAVAVRDFDGDGIVDLAASHCCGDTEMSFLHGHGDGTFQPETAFNGGPSPRFLSVTDLNGDGRPDLLVGGVSGSLTSLLNLGQLVSTTVNSASFAANTPIAPASIAAIFGSHLGVADSDISNTVVSMTDSAGSVQQATLFYVSPTQINFAVPAGLALGAATVTVTSSDGVVSAGAVTLSAAAPGLYVASGLAAGSILQIDAEGNQMQTELVTANSSGALVTTPITFGSPGSSTYLVLYGTGIRGADGAGVSVNIGSTAITPAYDGAQGSFIGEDQVNVLLPNSLKGTGNTNLTITAGGITSNTASVTIQ